MTEDVNNPDEPTKDLTANLSDRELLIQMRNAVGDMNRRLERLETKAYDTQPLPVDFDARFTALEKAVRLTNHKLDELNAGILDTKATLRDVTERVDALERRPN